MLLQDLLIFKLNYYEIREKQERVQISKGNPYKREKDYHVLKMSWKNWSGRNRKKRKRKKKKEKMLFHIHWRQQPSSVEQIH